MCMFGVQASSPCIYMFPDTWHKMLTKVCLLVLLHSQEGVGNTGVNMLVKTSSIDQNDQEVASQKEVMVNMMLSTVSTAPL